MQRLSRSASGGRLPRDCKGRESRLRGWDVEFKIWD